MAATGVASWLLSTAVLAVASYFPVIVVVVPVIVVVVACYLA